VSTRVEVRWDPLAGHTARLVTATSGALSPCRPAGARRAGGGDASELPVLC
jgi:hypothetical protein